ncbi:MAG: hypothetical protein GY822_25520 [Deltaproteobacteria bacterium]|nr:hypothetical protein [Deltaproteobacteria bacterium]
MSSLWHDPDYNPVKKLDTPLVTRGLEEMALPSEEHKLPEGHSDPFAKQDAIYDIAAQDMERGIKGMAFLNGEKTSSQSAMVNSSVTMSGATGSLSSSKVMQSVDNMNATVNPTAPKDHATHTQDVERLVQNRHLIDPNAPTELRRVDHNQAVQNEVRKRAQVGLGPTQRSSTKTSNEGMDAAVKSIEMAQGIGLGAAAVAPGLDPSGAAAAATGAVKAGVLAKNAVDIAGNIDKQYEAHSKINDDAHRSVASHRHRDVVEDDEW